MLVMQSWVHNLDVAAVEKSVAWPREPRSLDEHQVGSWAPKEIGMAQPEDFHQ